jgi:hypothetical protein
MQAMGVLEHFTGILCHDHWKPYFQFNCQHALWESSGGNPVRTVRPAALAEPDMERYTIRLPA